LISFCVWGAFDAKNVPMSLDPPKVLDKNKNKTVELTLEKTPQFVMLTYDDAVTIINYKATYQKLFNIQNKGNGCNISATFFVSHDNTNYQLVNDLFSRGHEIASHTITHRSPQDFWKTASADVITQEIVGQREIISKFADIPDTHITGFRAPFLQMAGDRTFEVLQKNHFKYDSSMPTQSNSKPWPIFPYTLDNGFKQDCVIPPCPSETPGKFNGFFEIPIVDYWRERVVIDGQPPVESPCSMVDLCLPAPTDATDAMNYFLSNFNRHYENNRAPFPVFLHETWLSQNETVNKEGYFNFIKKVAQYPDVFFVTIQDVIEWMENPVPLDEYISESKSCKPKVRTPCPVNINDSQTLKSCKAVKGDASDANLHLIQTCNICPTHYPRIGHTSGDD